MGGKRDGRSFLPLCLAAILTSELWLLLVTQSLSPFTFEPTHWLLRENHKNGKTVVVFYGCVLMRNPTYLLDIDHMHSHMTSTKRRLSSCSSPDCSEWKHMTVVLKQHDATFSPQMMLIVQCDVSGWLVSLSLVSALCNLSEWEGRIKVLHTY